MRMRELCEACLSPESPIGMTAWSIGLSALLVTGLNLSGGENPEAKLDRLQTEWNETVERGIEPYIVRGIDQFYGAPYRIEYLNIDGDGDYDLVRFDDSTYREVSFQVSDIEEANR